MWLTDSGSVLTCWLMKQSELSVTEIILFVDDLFMVSLFQHLIFNKVEIIVRDVSAAAQ